MLLLIMFTGIIASSGIVKKILRKKSAIELVLQCDNIKYMGGIKIGSSIAINGVCLTVFKKNGQHLNFNVVEETINRSTLGYLQTGMRVNLEPSLKIGDSLDGHLVTGHVDGVGTLIQRKQHGDNTDLVFCFPNNLKPYIVEKGSITVDGVSLTITKEPLKNASCFVNFVAPYSPYQIVRLGRELLVSLHYIVFQRFPNAGKSRFAVTVIPHTMKMTTLGNLNVGEKVNLEIDVIARYCVNALHVSKEQLITGP